MPTTMETNITEKMLRWPMTSVTMPMDHPRLTVSVAISSTGLTKLRKAPMSSAMVSTEARIDATSLSAKAVDISSFEMAGPPVTPASTSGKSGRSAAMVRRMASMVLRLSVKLPSSRRCCTNRNSQCLSEEKKKPASGSSRRPTEKAVDHGEV
jgi:hypothetical protein